MIVDSGQRLGTKLCEALGLDPWIVKSITVHCPAKGMATATVESYVSATTGLEVEVAKFSLTPLPDP